MIQSVAFLHNYLALGGSDKISWQTAQMLAKRGVKSLFLCQRWEEDEFTLPSPKACKLEVLPNKKKLLSPENCQAIRKHLELHQVKILFICCPIKEIPEELAEYSACKLIFWEHSLPFAQLRIRKQQAFERASSSLIKSISYRLFGKLYYGEYGLLKAKLRHRYRKIIPKLSHYIVLTEAYAEELILSLKLNQDEQKKFLVLKNSIELQQNPQLEKQKVIVYMGRLSLSDKRIDRLLLIWKKCSKHLSEWTFKIYGNGVDEEKLKAMAQNLNLERIVFSGFTSKPQEVYDEASILCLSSSVESWGLVLSEAQNNGTIPIAFDVSEGVHSILEGAGVLIPPFDLDAYAQALTELCLNNERRLALQEKCLERRLAYCQACNEKVWSELLEDF